jgi:hypothetical protein
VERELYAKSVSTHTTFVARQEMLTMPLAVLELLLSRINEEDFFSNAEQYDVEAGTEYTRIHWRAV